MSRPREITITCHHFRAVHFLRLSAMFTVASSSGIYQLDSLKHVPPLVPLTNRFSTSPTGLAVSGSTVFVAHETSLYAYKDKAKGTNIFTSIDGKITCVLVKEVGGQVVLSAGNKIHTLTSDGTSLVSTIEGPKPILGLSLSNDSTLLAAYSMMGVAVHNLVLGSQTNIRLPTGGHPGISRCVFHPHTRQRLLLCAGTQLIVYDVTKPTLAVKSVTLAGTGNVVGLSCSPFSKSLVAVAMKDGNLFLVDTDKDKR